MKDCPLTEGEVQFLFCDYVLDVKLRELKRGSDAIAVAPQVFDLLVYLLQNRDHVVSKDELLASVWGGRIVSESTLTSRINAARKAVGDSGEEQRLIKTIARKGFRFVGAVDEGRRSEAEWAPDVPPRKATSEWSSSNLSDTPSIAVLPFTNLSGDLAQQYFADGITEEITTGLSRLRWLFVIARDSSFIYKNKAVDVQQVARELRVRYLLQGGIRVADARVRVTSQLVDAETGRHIWAERYDRKLDDIFTVQDEITENVIAAIEPRLYVQEGSRAQRKPTTSLDAWGCVARALPLVLTLREKENRTAQELLQRAIAIDPRYGRSHAILSWAQFWEAFCWWAQDPSKTYRLALDAAKSAVALDPHDPWALAAYGMSLSTVGQHEQAEPLSVGS